MPFLRNFAGFGFLFLLLIALPVGAQTNTKAARISGDQAVIEAKKAFEKKDLAAFSRFDASGHVLAPYVTYWYLRTALEKDANHLDQYEKAVRDFIEREKNTPLAQPLLSAWLKALAKKQEWIRFAMDYPPLDEDTELQCYGVSYRFQRDGESALTKGKPLWFTGKSLPKSCDAPIDAMFDKGVLTSDDIRARMRLASEEGNTSLVKALWTRLPAAERADEKTFVQAERQPLKYLGVKPKPKDKGAAYLLFFALENAARKDVASARHAWLSVRDDWPEAEQQYGNARIAYRATRQLHPDALRYYKDAGNVPLDVAQQIWRIRAALQIGDYAYALTAISLLPSEEQSKDIWRYWRARTLEKQNTETSRAEAKTLYTALSQEVSFYGMLAGERIGIEKLTLTNQPLPASEEMIDAFLKHPSIQRVIKLDELGMRRGMLREWWPLVRVLGDDSLHVAAQAMQKANIIDRSIAAADRTQTRHDFSLRYPRPFNDAFQDAAKQQDVDVNWLYAVARQESRFMPEIVSSAGAIGLMQLMPRTASWVAKQLKISGYKTSQLNDPAVNAVFGAFYLRHCLDDLDNSLALAAAAYNAGPGRAKRWRNANPADGDVWVETIPFDETRDYVKKVLANAKVYAQMEGNTFSILDTLKLINSPPDGTTDDALTDEIENTQGNITSGTNNGTTATP